MYTRTLSYISAGRALAVLGLCVLTMLSGCFTTKQVERTRHYTLNPPVSVDTTAPLDLTLGIRPLFSSRSYGLPMAILGHDHQLLYRERDQWAESPANTVTRALYDAIAATNRFEDVGDAADMARPDLLLTGEVRMFHENRTESPSSAELEVRLDLRPARDPGSLWAGTLRESIVLDAETPTAFAVAMNEALARMAARAAEAIAAVEPPEQLLLNKAPLQRQSPRMLQREETPLPQP